MHTERIAAVLLAMTTGTLLIYLTVRTVVTGGFQTA